MSSRSRLIGITLAASIGLLPAAASAQRQDRDGRDRNAVTRLDRGLTINVRAAESIDANRADYRVFKGIVDQDVRGEDGQLAIPRGANAELMVRESQPGEMVLDLESISVNGQRYDVKTDPEHVGTTGGRPNLVGSIINTINGNPHGRDVRVPGGTVMNFRLERSLEVGVADLGVNRNGVHYHDWYGRGGGR